jgi:hypothetical protein
LHSFETSLCLQLTATVRSWPITLLSASYAASLYRKSHDVTRFLERRMAGVCAAWLIVASCLALFRLAAPASAIHNLADASPILTAYTAIILAPILGYLIGRHAFSGATATVQPRTRLALIGRWHQLGPADARARPTFGPVGFMASLLVGMLLNVVVRTFEFFTAIPAMSAHAPAWGQTMFTFMALDVVITSFFYMVAFIMALRTIPLFPRMLVYAWLIDVMMQVVIAKQVAAIGGVPEGVVPPLLALLEGNMTKVAISVMVWLPYLLLSERVNVTYRHRTDARLKAA